MQPEKIAEVNAWLKKSADDIRSAEVDLSAAPPIIEDALFHCQQAVEKALKGFLTANDHPFRKTHDLDVLAQDCIAVDPSLAGILEPAIDLTVYAWLFRYPGDAETPDIHEAGNAIELARNIHGEIRQRVKE